MRIFTNPRFLALLVSAAVLAGIAIPLSNYMLQPANDDSTGGEDVDFDLSGQPLVADLGVADGEPRETDQTWYLERERRITLLLPKNDRSVTLDITAIDARRDEDSDRLGAISFFLPHRTQKETIKETERLARLIGIGETEIQSSIQDWLKRIEGGEGSVARVVLSNLDAVPYPSVEIRTTFDRAKPWYMQLAFVWDITLDPDSTDQKTKTKPKP